MDSRPIPYAEMPNTSRLFRDYLYDFARVSEFYPFPPLAPESFRRSAESLRYTDEMRQAVVAVLREQNEGLQGSAESLRNLDRLSKPGCSAVVTGQQVGLFSGPAFILYKALTAIQLARSLSQQGVDAVPIFWLETEDHDFVEVNHCFIQDREGKPVRLDYSETPQVPNGAVGAVILTEAIRPLLTSLRSNLPDSPAAQEIIRAVEECYQPNAQFGSAFGRLLARLLGAFGVVLVQSNDSRLHGLGAPVFRAAIETARTIVSDLLKRNQRLLEKGYHAQAHVAENTSLLFLYENGQRTALRLEESGFRSARGTSYTERELLGLLEESPHLFSANVLLRPVLQDALLPTVAYVGGPSEVAYLAQAGPMYERVLGRMPVVVPRASFTILEPGMQRLLVKYGLSLADVCAGKQALRQKMALHYLPPDLTSLFERATATLRRDLEAIQGSLARLDPTLADAAKNSGQKMQYQLSSLERKASAAVQSRTDLIERDAARLENSLCPDRVLQERHYCGVSLLARHGPSLLAQLSEQISFDSADHQLVTP
jgi:bacillithiol biosynthesis cysteine-adding enzyme BshC